MVFDLPAVLARCVFACDVAHPIVIAFSWVGRRDGVTDATWFEVFHATIIAYKVPRGAAWCREDINNRT